MSCNVSFHSLNASGLLTQHTMVASSVANVVTSICMTVWTNQLHPRGVHVGQSVHINGPLISTYTACNHDLQIYEIASLQKVWLLLWLRSRSRIVSCVTTGKNYIWFQCSICNCLLFQLLAARGPLTRIQSRVLHSNTKGRYWAAEGVLGNTKYRYW